jgi:hypothetical protein
MSQPLNIIIVERTGTLKMLAIKDFKEDELFKKCGFKKADNFLKQTEWNTKYDGKKYCIQIFAKDDGRANSENKYDFPPPIDNKLFYGCCAIVGQIKNGDGSKLYTNLSLPMWEKIYEKLFGGFEDITKTVAEDENEEDELENVPKHKKTKHGYLKDGFVVDSSDADESETVSSSETEDDNLTEETEEDEKDSDVVIEDIGSELSEDSYDYPLLEKVEQNPPLGKVEPK